MEKRFQKSITQRREKIHGTLKKESREIQSKVREAVIGEILKAFPSGLIDHFNLSLSLLTL